MAGGRLAKVRASFGTIRRLRDDKELFGDPANRLASYLLDLAVAKGAVDRALAQKLTAQGLR